MAQTIDPYRLYSSAFEKHHKAVRAKEKAERNMIILIAGRVESEMLRRGLREFSQETTFEATDLAERYVRNDGFGPEHLLLVDAVESTIDQRDRSRDI